MSDSYQYSGARALVKLHERHLREFLDVWREAEQAGVRLPVTSDPNYRSMETLLAHVLGCAARYLLWICKQTDLPLPTVESRPGPKGFSDRAAEYLEAVLVAWDGPLRELTEEQVYSPAFDSSWGPPYCIDAMLEHAVMHPIRHTHQLRGLMGRRVSKDARAR